MRMDDLDRIASEHGASAERLRGCARVPLAIVLAVAATVAGGRMIANRIFSTQAESVETRADDAREPHDERGESAQR